MTESEFLAAAENVLDTIEAKMDRLCDDDVVDVECKRSGNVLEIEFIRNGSKIIINSQAPMQEMWIAARSGGFHYRMVEGQWIDTRKGDEMYEALSQLIADQSGSPVKL